MSFIIDLQLQIQPLEWSDLVEKLSVWPLGGDFVENNVTLSYIVRRLQRDISKVAALFHIGSTKSHPEITELLSNEAKDFLLKFLHKKKRLAEMSAAAKVSRFGSVIPISGSDFVKEVSQAPSDVWVVVILYKDGYQQCGVLLNCLEELATRYPATKFVKIISTDCTY